MSAKKARPRWWKILRRVLIGLTVVALALGAIAAWAVNRYIIDHVEIADVAAYEAPYCASTSTVPGSTSATTAPSAAVVTDDSYTYGGATITVRKVVTGSGNSMVTYFVADVVLGDVTELRSAFADNSSARTSSMNERVGLDLAVSKVITEAVLFAASYQIEERVVFARPSVSPVVVPTRAVTRRVDERRPTAV